jgi:hypothetical protein
MCQLNLTLEPSVAEHVETIGYNAHLRPSGAGRVLLEQRLALEKAGWGIGNKELAGLFEKICRVGEEDLNRVKEIVARMG